MLADSATDLYVAAPRSTLQPGAAATGADVEVEMAMAKSLATRPSAASSTRHPTDRGAAVVEDHPLARRYRQVRGWRIAEGTTEILRLTIARGLLARRRAAALSAQE
ncbi:MAG: acyl-CoA dehydrogenase family protein [Dehalococcoidia bacterium]